MKQKKPKNIENKDQNIKKETLVEGLEKAKKSSLHYFVGQREDLQKLRESAFNRIVAICKTYYPITPKHKDPEKAKRELEGKYANMANTFISGDKEAPRQMDDIIWYFKELLITERKLNGKLDDYSFNHLLREKYLDGIQGIGGVFSAGLIALLDPIDRFDTPSKLWAYAGLGTDHYESECGDPEHQHRFITTSRPDKCPVKVKPEKYGGVRLQCNAKLKELDFKVGTMEDAEEKKRILEAQGYVRVLRDGTTTSNVEIEKIRDGYLVKTVACKYVKTPPERKVGYVLCINTKLRTHVWKIAISFVKQNPAKSQYRRLYDDYKARMQARPDLQNATKGRIHQKCLRYIGKRLLLNIWLVWRHELGLPTRKPYVIDKLGHTSFEAPHVDHDPAEKRKNRKVDVPDDEYIGKDEEEQ